MNAHVTSYVERPLAVTRFGGRSRFENGEHQIRKCLVHRFPPFVLVAGGQVHERVDGAPRQRSGSQASHLQAVDRGPAFRLARKGFPHGRPRQSSEGPERSGGPAKRVDGRG